MPNKVRFIEVSVSCQESECTRSIDFPSIFNTFSIEFWECSDGVISIHFVFLNTSLVELRKQEMHSY